MDNILYPGNNKLTASDECRRRGENYRKQFETIFLKQAAINVRSIFVHNVCIMYVYSLKILRSITTKFYRTVCYVIAIIFFTM